MAKILFLGDSITHGNDWASKIDFAQVENWAVPGYSTDDILEQFLHIASANHEVISLMIGSNDFGNPALNRSSEETGLNILKILENLHANNQGSQILIHSIPPRGSNFSERIRKTNEQIRSFKRERVTYIDLWPILAQDDALNAEFLLQDGFDVHLNRAGYQAWEDSLLPVLKILSEQNSLPFFQNIKI